MTSKLAYQNGKRIYLKEIDQQPYLDGKPLRLVSVCRHPDYGRCWIYDEGQIANFTNTKADHKRKGYGKIYMPFAQPMTNNNNNNKNKGKKND